jgi:tetratricopeptide (TPR) repeat protein
MGTLRQYPFGFSPVKDSGILPLMRVTFALLSLLVSGCAPWAAQHQADAAFRQALTAQLASRTDEAEQLYRQIIALGFDWSPVWNNLAVIEVRRHQFISARHLLSRAVAANDRDVVALTNYGVMSYYLADYPEARRTLVDAQAIRRDILNHMPTLGRSDYLHDHFERATERLVQTAQKYLTRIDQAQQMGAEVPSLNDAVAAIQMHDL